MNFQLKDLLKNNQPQNNVDIEDDTSLEEEEEDNEEQDNPEEEEDIEEEQEEAEVQQNQRQSPVRLGQLFDSDEVLDNQVQPYIPAHLFNEEKALTQQTVNAWRTAVERQAQILENRLGVINAQTATKEIQFLQAR